MELIGKRVRSVLGVAWQFQWATGYMLTAGIGYFIRDYVKFQIAASLPVIVLFAYIVYVLKHFKH